jgi:hypothetical protein
MFGSAAAFCSCTALPPNRINKRIVFYNRVPKCASTTLLAYISNMSAADAFFGPPPRSGPQWGPPAGGWPAHGGWNVQQRAAGVAAGWTDYTDARRVAFDLFQSSDFDWSHFHPDEQTSRRIASSMVALTTSDRPRGAVFERHLHFVDFQAIGLPNPAYINLLRDPVAVRSSNFRFHRDCICRQRPAMSTAWPFDEWCKADWPRRNRRLCAMDLNDCFADFEECHRLVPPNALGGTVAAEFLCGTHPDCTRDVGAKVARAKVHMRDVYAWVGVAERLPESLHVLQQRLPAFFGRRNDTILPTMHAHELARLRRRPTTEDDQPKEGLLKRIGRWWSRSNAFQYNVSAYAQPTNLTVERMLADPVMAGEVELYRYANELLDCRLRDCARHRPIRVLPSRSGRPSRPTVDAWRSG